MFSAMHRCSSGWSTTQYVCTSGFDSQQQDNFAKLFWSWGAPCWDGMGSSPCGTTEISPGFRDLSDLLNLYNACLRVD